MADSKNVASEQEYHGPDVRPKTQSSSKKFPSSDTQHTSPSQKAAVKSQNPSSKEDVKSKRQLRSQEASQSVSPRVTTGVPASVERITRYGLSSKAQFRAGLGEHGDIVLADDKQIYKMTHNGQKYSQTLSMRFPKGIYKYCDKAVDSDNRALIQAGYNKHTICYNDAGKEVYKLKHKGQLINIVGGELFYSQKIPGTSDWEVQVKRGTPPDSTSCQEVKSTRPVILEPPAPHKWGLGLSACRVHDRCVVSDGATQSLDIFSTEGRHILHTGLLYMPCYPSGITSCPSGHLLIAENLTATIHIHDLQGREVGSFTHQDLQLGNNVWLRGICYNYEDGLLHVCAGDPTSITSLHAYRVLFK